MLFVRYNNNVLSDSNIAPTLSTNTVMSYLTTNTIKNITTGTNIMLQHTFVIDEYSAFVTDIAT